MGGRRMRRVAVAGAILAAIAAAVILGVALRLADPLSDPVLAAEDPYTHMALTREHLRDGTIDALNPGTGSYPPGMHAVLATTWAYTGMDLETLFRIGPALLGALGILGVALLLWHHSAIPGEGTRVSPSPAALAATIGAVAMAVVPELVFRGSILVPTTLDVALLPFLLFALLQTLRGHLLWAVPATLLAAFQLLAHPWLFALLLPAGAVFLLLALIIPWPKAPTVRLDAKGAALAIAVLGCAGAASLAGCWAACGPGFADVLPGAGDVTSLAPYALAASLVAAAFTWRMAPRLQRRLDALQAKPQTLKWKAVASMAVAVVAATLVWRATSLGLPESVEPVHMFGWPILAFALVALVALPFLASPAAHAGAALVAATAPMALFDPFHSPYWPHRTATYLAVGLVLLAGIGAAAFVQAARKGLTLHAARLEAHSLVRSAGPVAAPPVRAGGAPRPRLLVAVAASPLFLTLLVGAGVYAATPAYAEGWYRLYGACETDALHSVAQMANASPDTLVVAGSWQAKLVLAASTENASRVWYSNAYFMSERTRDGLDHRTVLAVVDPRLPTETPDADLSFLSDPGWKLVAQWCPASASAAPGTPSQTLEASPTHAVSAYLSTGASP